MSEKAKDISVIICAHNPSAEFLLRTLRALRAQTLPVSRWELTLIDNASKDPLEGRFDLGWHPSARHVREDELGLTPARLRGIAESRGDLIVFVDDDNVLPPNYLATALEISAAYSFLGAWGGSIEPEFEIEPPAWTRPHLSQLALRSITKVAWSNEPAHWQTMPWGAGLCIRMMVARKYAEKIGVDPVRRALGRKGNALTSAEDTDMVSHARECGLGWGVFPQLVVTHIIPASRLKEDYLLRLAAGLAESNTALSLRLGQRLPPPRSTPMLWLRALYTLVRRGPRATRFFVVEEMGRRRAFASIEAMPRATPPAPTCVNSRT